MPRCKIRLAAYYILLRRYCNVCNNNRCNYVKSPLNILSYCRMPMPTSKWAFPKPGSSPSTPKESSPRRRPKETNPRKKPLEVGRRSQYVYRLNWFLSVCVCVHVRVHACVPFLVLGTTTSVSWWSISSPCCPSEEALHPALSAPSSATSPTGETLCLPWTWRPCFEGDAPTRMASTWGCVFLCLRSYPSY